MQVQQAQQLINFNRLYPTLDPSQCGYCHKNGSTSWSFTKTKMKAQTYNILMERGWRRSGTYYYKPDIAGSCCKLWSHRMDVAQWKIKKDQRKTWRTMGEWVRGMAQGYGSVKDKSEKQSKSKAELPKQAKGKEQQNNAKSNQKIENNQTKMAIQIPDQYQKILTKTVSTLQSSILQSPHQFQKLFSDNLSSPEILLNYKVDEAKLKLLMSQPNAASNFYTNYLMLLFGINKSKFNKNFACGEFVKCVKQFIEREGSVGLEEGWQLEVEKSGYLLFRETAKFAKKQMKPKQQKNEMKEHKKAEAHMQQQKPLNKESSSPNLVQYQLKISSELITYGPLRVEIVKADCTKQSWQMYVRYNRDIHEKEDKSQSSYSNFLCAKALHFGRSETSQVCQKKYECLLDESVHSIEGKRVKLQGCYHMNYYVGKQFIGVGVVDFLPNGLSSVYFFYEPKYKSMRLGVFSSLLEIEYVRWLSLSFPQFKYYYMGFYIQNCTKMNYKGNYEPFELLCPVTYQFVEFSPAMKKKIADIEDKKEASVRLDQNGPKLEDMDIKPQNVGPYILSKTKIKHQNQILEMKNLSPTIIPKILGILKTMVEVWGKKVFESLTFVFSD